MFIKSTLIGVGAVTLIGSGLLLWGPVSSYVRTGAQHAADSARKMVPTDFEINRIGTLIGDLDEVIAEQQAKLVKQQLDLEYLQRDVGRIDQEVSHLTAEVGEARRVLGVQQTSYLIGNRAYDRPTVEREAKAKAERLIRAREIHAAKQQTLQTLTAALAQADAQLSEARLTRENYQLRLVELDAKAENVAIRKELVVSLERLPNALDAGAFQEVEQAFSRVEKDLAVQDRLLEERYKGQPTADAISFTAPAELDVVAVLDRALGLPAEPTTQVPVLSQHRPAAPARLEVDPTRFD